MEEERRTLALSYLISNLFEAENLDECLDIAIKGLAMLDFFQSQISLLEEGYFLVKRNHMDKKYQFLLEKIGGRRFLGLKIDAKSSFASHLLDSKIVTTLDIKDAVKVKLEDIIKGYLPKEWRASKRVGVIARIVSVLPGKMNLFILPLIYRGKVIGGLGISGTSLESGDLLFLRNVCELFAQAFEKAQTRDELRKSDEKYRQLVESLYEGIWVIDKDAYTTFVNSRMAEMLGYTVDEMQGKHLFSFMDDHGVEIAKHNLERRKRGIEEEHDFEFLRKDGTRVYTRLATSPLTDAQGNYMGAIAGVIDITDHKRVEEALRQSEEKFRNIFESANDCMALLDSSGRILDANRKAVEVFGGSKKDVLGKHFTKVGVVSPRDIPRLVSAFAKGLAGKRPTLNISIKNKKGQEIHLECLGSLVRMGDEGLRNMIIARDVTERKKAEKALVRSEEKYRGMVELAPDGIVTVDMKGVITSVNTAFSRLTGYPKEEIVGKHFTKLRTIRARDIPKYFNMFSSFARGKISTPFEFVYLHKDGTTRWGEVHGSLIKADGKTIGFQAILRDITERKKAEEELIRLSSAVKMSTDSIVISDLGAKIIDVNEATLKMYSTDDKRDLIGKSSFDLIAPEEREKAFAGVREVLKKGYLKSREYHIVTKDDSRIPVDMSAAVMKDADGKPIGFVGISRDITERKKMEEALKRQRDIAITLSGVGDLSKALNRLFDNLLEIEEFDCAGFYLVDKDTGELDMITYRGLPDGFVEKVGHLDADSPYAKVVMEGKPVYQKTSDFPQAIREDLQSDGILAVAAIPVQYEGEVIGDLNLASHTHDEISAFTRHVLESVAAHIGETVVRARMEEKLRESEEKLRQYSEHLEELVQKRTEELLESERRYSALVEEARDGVAILQDARIIFVNKRGAEVFGYSRGELIGLPFEKVVDEKYLQTVKERYMRRLRGEEVPPTYEIALVAKSGKRIPVEISATLIHHQGRPADLVLLRDIRERKRMEAERLRLEKLATIGELATMVGHDLRNPLQAIENATYYLNNELSRFPTSFPIPQKTTEVLQALNDSVNYADKIVRDLQDFATKKQPILKKTNINTIVKEALSHVKAPENVKLITKLAGLPEIEADKNMIKRAFLNLAINGIQAMENGGGLKVSTKKKKGFVEISFKDTGIGISQKDIGKIFTPFFTTRAKGMGMGLPICKKFVEAHGGSIHVKSQEGKGSTFTVKMPIQQESGGENP
jgi:PAS domain S-box-containing protein